MCSRWYQVSVYFHEILTTCEIQGIYCRKLYLLLINISSFYIKLFEMRSKYLYSIRHRYNENVKIMLNTVFGQTVGILKYIL